MEFQDLFKAVSYHTGDIVTGLLVMWYDKEFGGVCLHIQTNTGDRGYVYHRILNESLCIKIGDKYVKMS